MLPPNVAMYPLPNGKVIHEKDGIRTVINQEDVMSVLDKDLADFMKYLERDRIDDDNNNNKTKEKNSKTSST